MTEFTSEFIKKQKKMLDGYTTEGVFTDPHVNYEFEIDILLEHYPEALDHIEHLQQRIAELEQERRWIPVSEPVEGNNLEILCYSNEAPHYESYFAIYIDGIFGEYESGKFLEVFPKPTHYMYKPKPPKYKPPQPPKEGE